MGTCTCTRSLLKLPCNKSFDQSTVSTNADFAHQPLMLHSSLVLCPVPKAYVQPSTPFVSGINPPDKWKLQSCTGQALSTAISILSRIRRKGIGLISYLCMTVNLNLLANLLTISSLFFSTSIHFSSSKMFCKISFQWIFLIHFVCSKLVTLHRFLHLVIRHFCFILPLSPRPMSFETLVHFLPLGFHIADRKMNLTQIVCAQLSPIWLRGLPPLL